MDQNLPRLDVIGDSGPFSRLGKSIGYRIILDDAQFLLDCGAPVFQLLGPEGLESINGIIGTHAHEDHKRWFTDIALYKKFSSKSEQKVPLIASKEIIEEYRRSSVSALEETLSADAETIVNYSFHDYVDPIPIGPDPKYTCERVEQGNGTSTWRVTDQEGNPLPPDQAKVIKQEEIQKPRMLFKDPDEDIWVEPKTFYSYDDERFYDQNSSNSFDHENKFSITPIKSTAWHGPPTNSLLFEFDSSRLFFSSDTVYDPDLWKKLTLKRDPERKADEHPDKTYISGDINKFTEKVWSQSRYQHAVDIYDANQAVIHDVSGPWTTVHSDYKNVKKIQNPLLLTHSPDEFTTLEPMAHIGKSYVIDDNNFYEVTDNGEVFGFNATCYHKRFSQYYVGYKDPEGDHLLVRLQEGNLQVIETGEPVPDEAEILSRIMLYRDIGGEYFPCLPSDREEYVIRYDDQVEKLTRNQDGSEGRIVSGKRSKIGITYNKSNK